MTFDDVTKMLRDEDRAHRTRVSGELRNVAGSLERGFGSLLDSMEEVAAAVEQPALLAQVDEARSILAGLVAQLRQCAEGI